MPVDLDIVKGVGPRIIGVFHSLEEANTFAESHVHALEELTGKDIKAIVEEAGEKAHDGAEEKTEATEDDDGKEERDTTMKDELETHTSEDQKIEGKQCEIDADEREFEEELASFGNLYEHTVQVVGAGGESKTAVHWENRTEVWVEKQVVYYKSQDGKIWLPLNFPTIDCE